MANTGDKVKEGIHDAAEKVKDAATTTLPRRPRTSRTTLPRRPRTSPHKTSARKPRTSSTTLPRRPRMSCTTSARRSRTQVAERPWIEETRSARSAAGRPPPGEDRTDPSHKKSQENSLAFLFQRGTMKVVTEHVWIHIRLR